MTTLYEVQHYSNWAALDLPIFGQVAGLVGIFYFASSWQDSPSSPRAFITC